MDFLTIKNTEGFSYCIKEGNLQDFFSCKGDRQKKRTSLRILLLIICGKKHERFSVQQGFRAKFACCTFSSYWWVLKKSFFTLIYISSSSSSSSFSSHTDCTESPDSLGCPRGVMVKAMDCGIVVSEFVLQSHYYVYFRTNIFGKGMNPLILPAMGQIVPLLFF